jgi:DNA-binding FadR family transcriptional regulator
MRRFAGKRESTNDFRAYNFWDQKFHGAIAEASQNPIFISLYERLNALRSAPAWRTYRRDRMQDRFRSRSTREHRAIVAAIADRDPAAAFEAMRTHIANVQASFYSWAEMQVRTQPVDQK